LQLKHTIARDRDSEPAGELITKSWDDAQGQLD
jgi:hypothetical protein